MPQQFVNVVILLMLLAGLVFAALQIVSVRREQHIADVARAALAWRPRRRRPPRDRGPRDW